MLAAATGEAVDDVCPPHRSYAAADGPADGRRRARPAGPDARRARRPASRWPEPVPDVRWVELVGGPRRRWPSTATASTSTARLRPDRVVLVADAGLGTINAVSLSSAPFQALGLEPVVLLNRYDPEVDLHRRNRDVARASVRRRRRHRRRRSRGPTAVGG